MNLINLLQEQVGAQLIEKLPNLLGVNGEQAGSAVSKLIPTVMGFFGMQASTEEGASALFSGLKALPEGATDLIGKLSGSELQEQGESMLKGLVGDNLDTLKNSLSAATDLGEEKSAQLLGMAAPALGGGLKSYIDSNDVSLEQFSGLMSEQLDVLKESDDAGILSSLGLGAVGAGAAAVVANAGDNVRNIAGKAADTVGDKTAAATASIAGAGASAASAATSIGQDNDDQEQSGVKKWLLALAALMAFLFALATCSGKQDAGHATAPEMEAPKAEMPVVEAPEVEMPKVETPVVEAPEVEMPEVETPAVEAPEVEMPEVETPAVETPEVEMPKVEMSEAPAASVVETATDAVESAATATASAVEGAATKLGDMLSSTTESIKSVALPDGNKLELSDGSPVDKIVTYLKDADSTVPQAFILRGLNFETASSRITAASNKIIDDLAATMAAYGDVEVNLEGHTDSRGNDEANARLSQARAASVKQSLIDAGIASDRMGAEGFGESRPIADNATKAGQLENRRVEVIVTAK